MSAASDLARVYAAGGTLLSARRIDQLPEVVVRSAMDAMEADEASLMLSAPDHTLRLAYSSRIPREEWERVRIVLGGSVAGRVAEQRRPELVQDDPRSSPDRARSSLIHPLVAGERVLGVLNLSRRIGHRAPFTPADLRRANLFAAAVELALENAELMRHMIHADRRSVLEHVAGGLAHEVNTPIQFGTDNLRFLENALGACARVLEAQREILAGEPISAAGRQALAEAEEDADVSFLLERAPQAIGHLDEAFTRIRDVVLALKRLSTSKGEARSTADPNRALHSAVELVRSRLDAAAELVLDLGETARTAGLESDLIEAFVAILDNAIHASRRATGRGNITITSAEIDGEVLITFRDSGPGIAPDIAARIFDPFFTTRDVGEGRGLGLTIARNLIVERCGGSIHFESKKGAGTTFFVRLRAERKEDRR